jgi:hypothetical protein
VRTDLRKQSLSQVLRGFLEEDSSNAQPAPDRLLHNAKALNGAVAALRALAPREGQAQFLHQGIMAALDPAQLPE